MHRIWRFQNCVIQSNPKGSNDLFLGVFTIPLPTQGVQIQFSSTIYLSLLDKPSKWLYNASYRWCEKRAKNLDLDLPKRGLLRGYVEGWKRWRWSCQQIDRGANWTKSRRTFFNEWGFVWPQLNYIINEITPFHFTFRRRSKQNQVALENLLHCDLMFKKVVYWWPFDEKGTITLRLLHYIQFIISKKIFRQN